MAYTESEPNIAVAPAQPALCGTDATDPNPVAVAVGKKYPPPAPMPSMNVSVAIGSVVRSKPLGNDFSAIDSLAGERYTRHLVMLAF